ncbi:oxidative stress-induced growth inhibitor 2 isoform X2 [Bombina bombina]|uniref:oxidative stress-induced growth inhibitor 2 isoform X2 n=1 Tax=Bombina bombina TaxID=8345 RepID=UPI00235AEFD3|nr:oxidative stress-induced growth inhibitor 2 isoform X2 [Bombina bombina]
MLRRHTSYPEEFIIFIEELTRFLLTHNYFVFEGHYYLQRCGTAMGAKFAPSYANLYMGYFEHLHLFGGGLALEDKVVVYGRFIDDLIMIYRNNTELTIQEIVDHFNNNTLNLTFTHQNNDHIINFLDLTLEHNGEGEITTSTFRKPLLRNTILRADSCHAPHTQRGIPKGQYLRLRRNCSSLKLYIKQAEELTKRLVARGYKRSLLLKVKSQVMRMDRSLLLNSKTANSTPNSHNKDITRSTPKEDICFVTSYSNQFYTITRIIKKYLPVLNGDIILRDKLQRHIRFVAKRAPTIRDKVTQKFHHKIPPTTNWLTPTKGNYRCGHVPCKSCKYTDKSFTFTSSQTHKSYPITTRMDCTSTHIIYLITCSLCQQQYVGITTRPLKDRIREHLLSIEEEFPRTPVAKHFHTHPHKLTHFTFKAIEHIISNPLGGDRNKTLSKREVYWIFMLQTRVPQGMNKRYDVNLYIE